MRITPRYVVLHPQSEPIPADVAVDLKADVLRRLRSAHIAVVAIRPNKYGAREQNVEVVEYGPMGLQRAQDAEGNPFSQLRDWNRTRDPAARGAVRAFLAALDQHVLAALRCAHALTCDIYNWVSLDPERHGAAILSYPFFAKEMVGSVTIAAAIRRSGSLEEAIAFAANWERPHVRLMARLSSVIVWGNRYYIDGWLRATPNHLLPRSHAAWRRWQRIWEAVSKNNVVPDALRAKIAADTLSRRDWETELAPFIENQSLSAAVRSAKDALQALMSGVFVPAAVATGEANLVRANAANSAGRKSEAYERLFALIAGDNGLKPILALSKSWHDRMGRTDRLGKRERETIANHLELPRLLDEPWTSRAGITYRPLLTAGEVRKEGEIMGHCIGGYVDRCARGEVFAFHMSGRDLDATCTLCLDGKELSVDDARGYEDAWNKAMTQAAEDLLAHVQTQKIDIHGGEEARRIAIEKGGLHAIANNPDIALDRAEANFTAWLPILPKRLRARDVMTALRGPFFPVARKLCKREWVRAVEKEAATTAASVPLLQAA